MKKFKVIIYTSWPDLLEIESVYDEEQLEDVLDVEEAPKWLKITDVDTNKGFKIRFSEIKCISWEEA